MKQLLALLLLHLLIPPRRVSSDWLLVPAAYDDDGETTLSVLRPRPSEIFQAGELIPSVLSFEGVPRDWLLCVDFDAASSSSSSESSSSPSSLPSSSSSSVECGQPGRHIFEDVPCNSLQPAPRYPANSNHFGGIGTRKMGEKGEKRGVFWSFAPYKYCQFFSN